MSTNIGLAEYIAMLEKQERDLEQQLRDVRNAKTHATRVLGNPGHGERDGESDARHAEAHPKVNDGPYAGMGNEDAALKYLRSVGDVRKTAQVRDALLKGGIETEAENFTSTIFSSLRRLVEKEKVEKVAPGKWRALQSDGQTSLGTEVKPG